MNIKNNKGFTLIELILVISIGSLISFLSFQELIKKQDNLLAQSAGEQINKVGNAVNSYIAVHYDDLSKLQNSTNNTTDPGPRTCITSTGICTITIQTLINEGILPSTFSGTNSFNSGYSISLKRTGSSPYYNINGIVLTNNSWIGSGNKVRYDLLGTAMQKAGIDSGMSNSSTNKISGYNGSWSVDNTTFSNINKTGLLAYQVGYGSYSYSIYLRRDGTLPMTGNLDMGTQSINNAKDITASGTTQSGTLRSTGATAVGTTLNVAGTTTLSGAVSANNNLNVAGTTTLAGTNVNGQLNANSNFMAAGTSNLRGATTLNSTLNVGGTSTLSEANVNGVLNANSNFVTAGTTNLKGATTLNSTLNVAGTSTLAGTNINGILTANNAINANNVINASGNITSNGQVKGSTIVSSGRSTVGEYLQLNGTATANGTCSPNGLIGRTSTGDLLSCVSGKWTSIKGGYGGTFTTTGGEDAAGLSPVTTATAASNYLFNQGCKIRNSKTGSCGCPGGFTPVYTGGYSHSRNSGSEIEDTVPYGVWVCL